MSAEVVEDDARLLEAVLPPATVSGFANTDVGVNSTPGPRRTKVIHLYFKSQARLAEAVGLPTPYLCGRVARKATNAATERTVPIVGQLMVVSESRDCRQCVRTYEAKLRLLAELRPFIIG